MTTREFLTAIATSEDIASIAPKLTEEAGALIAKLDADNAARKANPSKTALENESIKASILAHLANMTEPLSAAELAEVLDITTAKAASLCGRMVKEGVLDRVEAKVLKEGKVNKYSVVQK